MLGNKRSTLECCGMTAHAKIHFRNHVCENTTRFTIIKTVLTSITNESKLKSYKNYLLTSLSKGTHRSAPQIKLWGGVNLKRIRENHIPHHNTIERIILLGTLSSHYSNTHYYINTQILNKKTRLDSHMTKKMIYGQKYKNFRNKHTQGFFHQNIRHIYPQYIFYFFSFSMQCMIPQIKPKYIIHVNFKNHTSFQNKDNFLTHSTCHNRMSQKTSSYSSAQRYKDAMLTIEGNPEKELSLTQKRSSNIDGTLSQKKANGKSKVILKRPHFWLGFQAINWTNRGNGLPMDSHEPVAVLVKSGMREADALECQNAISCFPFVVQEEWPNSREDSKEGQHYNLTQVPSDVEVDAFGYSLDYQIAIHFELGEKTWSKDTIIDLVIARLKEMDIAFGEDIGEPVTLMCYHKTMNWSGVIKLHLKSPQTDGKLQGLRPFILKLEDNKLKRGKVCRVYDSLALNN